MLSNSWFWIAFALLRIRPGQRHAVIEAGISKPGQMKGYARTVGPDVTVITAVGSEHHRSLGTLEVTRAEKSWMLQVLPASGTAVLNGDDPNVMWMKQKTRASVVTFGFGAECDVRADDVRLDWPRGTCFRLTAFGEERDVAVRLLGRHMVYPILAAIAVSHIEGCALDPTLARLRELAPTPGRMDPVQLPNGVTVLRDDFKSTLETVHTALDVLAQIPASRRVVLLGSVSEPPGPQRPIYQALGERVAAIASHLVIFNNEFEPYWSGARRGGMPRTAVTNAGRSARDAAEALRERAASGRCAVDQGSRPGKTRPGQIDPRRAAGRLRHPLLQPANARVRAMSNARTRLGRTPRDHVARGTHIARSKAWREACPGHGVQTADLARRAKARHLVKISGTGKCCRCLFLSANREQACQALSHRPALGRTCRLRMRMMMRRSIRGAGNSCAAAGC